MASNSTSANNSSSGSTGGIFSGIADLIGATSTTVSDTKPTDTASNKPSATTIVVLSIVVIVFGVIAYFVIFKKPKT